MTMPYLAILLTVSYRIELYCQAATLSRRCGSDFLSSRQVGMIDELRCIQHDFAEIDVLQGLGLANGLLVAGDRDLDRVGGVVGQTVELEVTEAVGLDGLSGAIVAQDH